MRFLNATAGLLALLLILPAGAYAEVFKYRDAEGRIYLTDKPMRGPYTLMKRYSIDGVAQPKSRGAWKGMAERRRKLAPMIARAARANRLKPELVHAVVRAESAYRSDAVSKKGAVGLMQLMPATAERLGVSNSYDPQQNLNGGSRYLRQLLDMFDNNLSLALAGYNAGENAVINHGNRIPPYRETQQYVQKVLAFYRENRADDRLAQR